jgi:hypothetical protein
MSAKRPPAMLSNRTITQDRRQLQDTARRSDAGRPLQCPLDRPRASGLGHGVRVQVEAEARHDNGEHKHHDARLGRHRRSPRVPASRRGGCALVAQPTTDRRANLRIRSPNAPVSGSHRVASDRHDHRPGRPAHGARSRELPPGSAKDTATLAPARPWAGVHQSRAPHPVPHGRPPGVPERPGTTPVGGPGLPADKSSSQRSLSARRGPARSSRSGKPAPAASPSCVGRACLTPRTADCSTPSTGRPMGDASSSPSG